MKLNTTDYNKAVTDWCKTVLECHNNLSFLTEDYSHEGELENRAYIDRNLIKMNLSAQKIIDLVFPIPNVGIIHGLPKEATRAADEPEVVVADRDHPEWDFKAWFGEKSGGLKKAVNNLMDYLEREYTPSEDTNLSESEWEEHIGEMIQMSMADIEGYANAILEVIESGRLVIKDVRVEE